MDNTRIEAIELRGSAGLGVYLRVGDDQRLFRVAPVRDPRQPRFWCLAAFECSACGIPLTGDAIWAGCPVLTVAGETFAARVAASLNHHLGMPELNVADDAAFVAAATAVGLDRATRDALHARLAECRARSGLFDMRAFAGDFVALLRTIALRHREGLAPAAIDGAHGPR